MASLRLRRLLFPAVLSLALAAYGAASDELPTQIRGGKSAEPANAGTAGWNVVGFGGRSVVALGSEELREGGGIAIQFERPDPRAANEGYPGNLVLELYFDSTTGGPTDSNLETSAYAIGALVAARYRWRTPDPRIRTYLDLGWGLQYTNRTTRDLESHVNSTPILAFGVGIGPPHREVLVGVRIMHISNAGLVGDNQGQNQVFVTLSAKI